MEKRTLNEELFDVILKHAVDDHLEEEYTTDMQAYENMPEPPYTDHFLAGIHKMSKNSQRHQ